MAVHVALLRAVNVGGRSLAMAQLREVMQELGLGDARTLLQSGNAVFASAKAPAALEAALGKAIANECGLETDVFVRTAKEWEAAIAANPFAQEAKKDPAHLLLMPLASSPTKAQVSALREAIRGPELVETDGRHAYLVYPAGIGTSKLTIKVIESKLGTRGTARNWNTARKLAALAKELA
ncbi:MAG TPA: DUF1697 domain-containing protein [Polyangiaceae bacterium]